VALFQQPVTSKQRGLAEAANRILAADSQTAKARKQRAIARQHRQQAHQAYLRREAKRRAKFIGAFV